MVARTRLIVTLHVRRLVVFGLGYSFCHPIFDPFESTAAPLPSPSYAAGGKNCGQRVRGIKFIEFFSAVVCQTFFFALR